MKPFWQYWLEVMGIVLIIFAGCALLFLICILLFNWIGIEGILFLMGFFFITAMIALTWLITDNDEKHNKPWCHRFH